MESPWFLRIVAFLLALLLYTSVNFQQDDTVQDSNGAGNNSETLEVPVNLYYDTDNLVVTGAPETVAVNIQGPRTIVQSAIRLKDFEVYIDLTNAEIGQQEVQIQIRNLSDKLTATIDPTYVTVSVQEKVTREFTVEPEFNADLLEEGFIAGQPTVDPKTVQITGAKDIVEQISYVKATIDTNGTLDNTVTREARVQVLDRFLNKLDVIVEPEIVDVTIPVRPIEKTVPIVIKREGVLPEGITVESMTLSEESTTIRAVSQEILDQINDIEIPVNMAELTGSREITIPLELPEGVLLMEPNEVTLTITLTKEVTFTEIPIEVEGLGENEEIEFVNPETGSINISLIGSPEVINSIEADALQVLIDVSTLEAGEHEVALSFTPPENVDWEISESTVQILIQEPAEG